MFYKASEPHNHRVTDTFYNCVEGRTTGQGYRHILNTIVS